MYDLIIKNALIYDGSGEKPFRGSVAVQDGKIAAMGTGDLNGAEKIVDAKGLCLAPGFIDVHSHADLALNNDPNRLHVLRMGVTTEVSGQCGNSNAMVSKDTPEYAKDFLRSGPQFENMTQQKAFFEKLPLGTNHAVFAGHGSIRGSVMGLESRHASDIEIKKMQRAVEQAVKEGALGYSTGLSYVPGISSDTHELTELAKAMKPYGGIYTTHSRSESMRLFASVAECIHIAREAKVSVNISHFKLVGKPFWERCSEALSMIDAAIEEGMDITLDCYPYTAASTTTLSAMPPKFLDGGAEAFAKSLEDPEIVEAIRKEIYEINDPSWDNSLYYVGAENFLIVRAAETPQYVGMTYAQVAEELGMEPFDAIMHLLRLNKGTIYECRFSMCEENVEQILKHPKCMVCSDGIFEVGDLSCHPRAFGSFPRYLGRYIRERKILSREEGIRRITSLPAKVYKLKGKGEIKLGYDADLVLFDYETIIDQADFLDPFKPNIGIAQVYVGGKLTLENNEPTGVWNGKVLNSGRIQ